MSDENIQARLAKVEEWLEEHVQRFSEPKEVELSRFDVDWSTFKGTFRLSLDGVAVFSKIRFSPDAAGKMGYGLPMFISPLGVAASYAAVEITPLTARAITHGLNQAIPKLKGCGKDPVTGAEITFHTPPALRLTPEALRDAKRRVVPQYRVKVVLDDL